MTRLTMVVAAGLLVAACSGGESATSTTSPTTTTVDEPTSVLATESTTTEAPSTTEATTTTTVAPTAPAQLATLASGLGEVTVIQVAVEGTVRPRFEWSDVDGVSRFVAVVIDETGQVLWAWSGEANSVTIGAGEVDRDGVGARLVAPGWLQVVGLAADGLPIASSEPVPVG